MPHSPGTLHSLTTLHRPTGLLLSTRPQHVPHVLRTPHPVGMSPDQFFFGARRPGGGAGIVHPSLSSHPRLGASATTPGPVQPPGDLP